MIQLRDRPLFSKPVVAAIDSGRFETKTAANMAAPNAMMSPSVLRRGAFHITTSAPRRSDEAATTPHANAPPMLPSR
jgi:hypothetical protein